MNKKYIVRLTATERGVLEGLVHTGKGAARTLTHARILLKADCGPDYGVPLCQDTKIAWFKVDVPPFGLSTLTGA